MKKILFLLLLITSVSYGQAIAPTRVKITNNAISTTAPFVPVQETDGFINKINKSDLIEVVEYASAVNLPVTGVAGKIYVTLDNNRLYRWTGTIYQDLGYVDISNKVDKVNGKSLISDAEITRLATLANYTHPTNHPPSIITQDASNRFVTDAEKTAWNAKQSAIGYTTENIANKNVANGYAGLGSDGKLISSQLPSITISDTYVVASQVTMLGLTGAEKGDVAVRTDLNKSFILKGNSYSTLADWQELLTPTSAVTTVFGRNGAVTAQTGDYTATMVGAPSGSGTSTGINTGDQTTITGNAGTATVLQTARTINGVSFNGSTNITIADVTKEPAFSKNTGFNKNFGTAVGTVAEGNDSRILNGQTAFGWGNHAGLYSPISGSANYIQNQNASAQSANMWISGSGIFGSSVTATKTINTQSGTSGIVDYGLTLHKSNQANNNGSAIGILFSLEGGGTGYGKGGIVFERTGGFTTGTIHFLNNSALDGSSPTLADSKLSINSAGESTFASSVTASGFFNSSDRRLKKILKRDGDVAYFKWKDGRDSKTHIGVIAQEVKKRHPDQVQKGEDGYLSVNYVELLVFKVRELEKKLEVQQKEINRLKKK